MSRGKHLRPRLFVCAPFVKEVDRTTEKNRISENGNRSGCCRCLFVIKMKSNKLLARNWIGGCREMISSRLGHKNTERSSTFLLSKSGTQIQHKNPNKKSQNFQVERHCFLISFQKHYDSRRKTFVYIFMAFNWLVS